MSEIKSLPNAVIQELEKAGITEDSVIFCQNNRWIYQTRGALTGNKPLSCHPIDSLGPFDIHSVDVTFILYPDASQYTITKIGKFELNDEEKATGVFAPITQITLQGSARETANIPDDATHFCWLYQPNNFTINDEMIRDNSYALNLLKLGGFAYFAANGNDLETLRLLRVNSLIISASNGLTFEGPHPWRGEFTEKLWNQKRFQPVTLSILREKGARYFAFINPYEYFVNGTDSTPWTPSSNGAFVYLFNEDHSSHPFDCYFSVADNCFGNTPSDAEQGNTSTD